MNIMDFSSLQPAPVWRHFSTLCQIPRGSGHEGAVREALATWACAHGLVVKDDAVGNLILRKRASPGYENRPGVVLQGHIDMVCQKNGGSTHDFAVDPIRPVLREGWVAAENTTLGADNGVGVALALAVLEADDLAHPALEVLLTVDEESGMHGALGLKPDALQGRLLLNLDTEEWGELYVGCAGSVDVLVNAPLPTEPPPSGVQAVVVRLSGLAGGHSGIDIHRGRGSAIKLLASLLYGLDGGSGKQSGAFPFRLAALDGGTAHNAIPREAVATLLLDDVDRARLQAEADAFVARLRNELGSEDSGLRVDITPLTVPPDRVLTAESTRTVLSVLHALPYGVRSMSERVPDVVDTSNNIGVARVEGGKFHLNIMVRSLREAGVRTLAAEIADLLASAKLDADVHGAGPCWTPKPDSALLTLAQGIYRDSFGSEAHVQVIHAGLECGVFSALWPEMDMISFGPTIQGAHAPGERVEVASVERAWRLLTGILAAIPAA
jgi:dipeptidase D